MNRNEWKELCKIDKAKAHYWYNIVTKKRISREFESLENCDKDAKAIHHLRDTEEQRKYNDEHYELFGFEIDENGNEHFEYGKYVVFWTKEHHNEYHKDSDETRHKKSVSGKIRWQDTLYRDHMIKVIRKMWSDEHRRRNRSNAYSGEGNPFYGKHHSQETKEKYFIGESNPMYGIVQSEEAKKAISEANKGKIVSDETRVKLSEASSGENNGMYGKHHTDETLNKLRNSNGVKLQRHASDAYREHKNNGGTAKWQDFRREFFNHHKRYAEEFVE